MLFWTIATLLTAAVTIAVLWPILRREAGPAPGRAEYDAEVYAAQLRELDADLRRGAIAAEEASVARAEIGRRLLKAASAPLAAPARNRAILTASVFFVGIGLPAATLAAYTAFGSPDRPDQPLAARLAVDPATADLPTLVAQAEAKLRARPDDGAGWDMLAAIYLRGGRPEDAARAAGEAIRLLGSTAERETTRGEALAQAAAGEVTDEAKTSFERALAHDPGYLPATFFLALDLSQENRFAEAGPAWRALIGISPPGAPWLQMARLAAEDAETRGRAPAAPGPGQDDMDAAAAMPAAERQAMIEGMVSQLAERLKSAPDDPEGWKRLMQSYSVLGDEVRARAALADATAAFAAGSDARGEIERFAAGLGLAGPGARQGTTSTQ